MVFLNPSILLGLLAASIPILIHLINFRKLRKVEFSTLAFLKELQKSKIRKIKIKQWLLLILRTLIIIFLVIAFARPTLESTTLIGATSKANSSSIFIIDNSLSMDYVDERGSLLNAAKSLAKQVVSDLQDGDEFIFQLGTDSTISFSTRESARSFIDDLNISQTGESLLKILSDAVSTLDKSQNLNKEIYLFTDFQASSFNEKDLADSISNGSTSDVKLYAFDMSTENPINYSVSDLNLENAIVELNKTLTFSATVYNHSSAPLNDARISLFLNSERVAQNNISIQPRKSKIVQFETSISEDGLIEAYAELEEDQIVQDNRAYLDFYIHDKIDILLVYEDEADIKFLEDALISSSESDRITIKKSKPENIIRRSLSDIEFIILTGNNFDTKFDFIDYVKKGGNILFIPGYRINTGQLSKLSSLLGLPQTENIASSNKEDLNYVEFGKIDFKHPVFLDLFAETASREVKSPYIYKYIKFSDPPKINSIIRLIDDTVFLGEYKIGKGKVMYFNTAFTLQWSNFPIKGIFAPLLSRISSYLSRSAIQNDNFYVGEKIPINTKNITYPVIDVIRPEGNDKINLGQLKQEIHQYTNSMNSGSYKFFNNDELIYFTTVNINPLESDLNKIELDSAKADFEKLFGNNFLLFKSDENYSEKIKQARFGTELWTYFLIIALLLAIIEMFVSRSTKKDLVSLD